MAYASIAGRARTSAKQPQAHAICDRCGFRWNWVDLQWQYEWRGPVVQNIRILVCRKCLDVPQENVRAITVPADPTPIINARPQDFLIAETNFRTASTPSVLDPRTGLTVSPTVFRVTQDCQNRTTLPFGVPVGLDQNAVMPLQGTVHYGVVLPVLSVMGNGTATVTVTCSAPHGLQNESQVSIQGLSPRSANGFYSVTPTTATAFTYMTYGLNPAQSLLADNVRIITCSIGLPLGYKRIPKIEGPALNIIPIPPTVCFLETEDGSMFLLEQGGGFLQLEQCGAVTTPLLGLESGTGTILLEGGFGSIELESGNG